MYILLTIICMITMSGCSNNTPQYYESYMNGDELTSGLRKWGNKEEQKENDNMTSVNIKIGKKNFPAIMYDNESARAIVEEMPFTLNMDDYASQEKIGKLIFDLPASRTETPEIIKAGDIYLWSGNNLVVFYTTFSNSYSYVAIGYIEDISGLRDALGNDSLELTFSVNE